MCFRASVVINQNDWTTFSTSAFPPTRMISAVLGLLTNPKEVKSCRTASLKLLAQFLDQHAEKNMPMDDARKFLRRWLPSALCELLATPSLIVARSLKYVARCFESQQLPFPVTNLIRIRALALKSNAEKEGVEVQKVIDHIFCALLAKDSGSARQANLISITAAVMNRKQLYATWKTIFLSCCAALPRMLKETSAACIDSLKNSTSGLNAENLVSITMLGFEGKSLHPSMISSRKQIHATFGLLQFIAPMQQQLSQNSDFFFGLLRERLAIVNTVAAKDRGAADPDDVEDIHQLSELLCKLSMRNVTQKKQAL